MLREKLLCELEDVLHFLRDLEHEPESIQEKQRNDVRSRLEILLHHIEAFLDEEGFDKRSEQWTEYIDLLYRSAMAVGAIAKTVNVIKDVVQLLR